MMKKHSIFVSLAVIILIAVFILPEVLLRMEYEAANNTYVIALDFSDVSLKNIRDYKESGVDTAVIKEVNGGFNKDCLDTAKKEGLDVALSISADGKYDISYFNQLEKTVNEYKVKYFLLKEGDKKFSDEKFVSELSKIIKAKRIICVLSENIPQNGNEEPFGYEKMIAASDMRVMRLYETLKISCVSDEDYDAIYYQMFNSKNDRNTGFLLVNQLTDSETEEKNAIRTMRSVKRFSKKMAQLGIEKSEIKGFYKYNAPKRTVYGAAAAIACLGAAYIYIIFFGKRRKKEALLYLLAPLSFLITLFVPEFFLKLYPTLYASAIPCILLTLVARLSKDLKYPDSVNIIICVLTGFTLLSVSGFVLGAVLSGSGFYLCIDKFVGVKLALVVPLAYAGFLWIYENGIKNILEFAAKNKLLIGIGFVIILIYLIRSGNTTITETERMIRNMFTEVAPARPRTKEFLIGWPCLFAFPVIYSKSRNVILKGIALFGAAILFSSALNSFCHGFTDIVVIYERLVNGLLFSLPISASVILLCLLFLKKKGS